VNVSKGMYGMVLMPLIHPEVRDVSSKIASLVGRFLPDRRNRPVYFNVFVHIRPGWNRPLKIWVHALAGGRR